MVLAVDFGGAVAKVLVAHENGAYRVREYPLGFKTRPHWTLAEALQYVITEARGQGSPTAVYASGEIASIKIKKILTAPPLDPMVVYQNLHLPVVDVGHTVTYVAGRSFRARISAAEVCRFLPRKITEIEVENYLGNKELYPSVVPMSSREHLVEQAIARVKILRALPPEGSVPDLDAAEVILSGAVLGRSPERGQALAILVDSLSLPPLVEVFLDTQLLAPSLATLAFFNQKIVDKILKTKPFLPLGSVFTHSERVKLQIDTGLDEPQVLSVDVNELIRLPLEAGKIARVQFDSPRATGEFEAGGGELGLVIDTRPKPLELPASVLERQRLLGRWQEALCSPPLFKK